jgi:hypothetical protein
LLCLPLSFTLLPNLLLLSLTLSVSLLGFRSACVLLRLSRILLLLLGLIIAFTLRAIALGTRVD